MSIFPRPLKKVLNKIIPFSQEDKVPTFNLGSGTADSTTFLRGDGTWSVPSGGSSGMKSGTATYSVTDLYTTTITGVTSYTTNDAYIIKFNTDNVDGASLNINGLGAVDLVKNNDVKITGGDIRVGQEFLVVYDGTNFQMIGIAPNQMFAYVTNADSVTINKGQPVYAFGAAGDRMSVKLAYNTSDATSAKTVGLVFSSSIAANGTGFIIMQGVIQNLNLAAYSAGDTLYLGATAGTLTKVKPYAPNHLVYIGVVERANAGNGQIYVRVQNGYELDEIHDVYINPATLADNDLIQYDSATSLWKNESLSTAGIQPTLVSGTSIKTINSTSLLGSGDISIPATVLYNSTSPVSVTGTTNETLIASVPIPTSITNATLRASFVVVVTTLGAAAPRTRMRIGTIANPTSVQLATQTQLGTNAVGSANAVSMYRTMPVVGGSSGNIKVISASSNVNADYGVATSYDTISLDWTTQRYIYFTITNNTLAAVTQCYGVLLEQLKQ